MTINATTLALSCCDLRLDYGTTRALDGVSLDFLVGESVAIMGPSGSGKTSLLHCLAGILRPTSGAVTVVSAAGIRSLDQLSDEALATLRRTEFGFVFQTGLLISELTALENVALPLMLNDTPRPEATTRAAQWLDRLGLQGMHDRRIGQLSGGQAQRVAIARAQVGAPGVVFADEPTGALDQATGAQVLDALLGSTRAVAGTLVVVTHDLSVAQRCQRIISLRDGRVVDDRRAGDGVSGPIQAQPQTHQPDTHQPSLSPHHTLPMVVAR